MDDFSVHAQLSGTLAVVTVGGDLDAAAAPFLRSKLQELITDGADRVVLDLRRVTFIESVALGVIIAARRMLGGAERSLCVVLNPGQASIRKVFTVTGLDRVFPVHPTIEAAEAHCAGDADAPVP
jgi:anti-sigma B factor antagonist